MNKVIIMLSGVLISYICFYRLTLDVMRLEKPGDIKTRLNLFKLNQFNLI